MIEVIHRLNITVVSFGVWLGSKRFTSFFPRVIMRLVILLAVCLIPFLVNSQTRTIIGKVVEEFTFETIPYALIQTTDGVELGNTDMDGNFTIEIANGTNELVINFLGFEPTSIIIDPNCDFLEIIMMVQFTYDFITIKQANRKVRRRFKHLKDRHREAFKLGVFKSKEPCITYKFIED
jgi:hypothetical protein